MHDHVFYDGGGILISGDFSKEEAKIIAKGNYFIPIDLINEAAANLVWIHPSNQWLSVMFKKIANWFKPRQESEKLENWFVVSWDDTFIHRHVSPPDKETWSDTFRWDDIIRICFEATDYMYPDDIYFFTSERPESYVIPSEASGASELWNLIIEKGLFDAGLAVEAASAVSGIFCWPREES